MLLICWHDTSSPVMDPKVFQKSLFQMLVERYLMPALCLDILCNNNNTHWELKYFNWTWGIRLSLKIKMVYKQFSLLNMKLWSRQTELVYSCNTISYYITLKICFFPPNGKHVTIVHCWKICKETQNCSLHLRSPQMYSFQSVVYSFLNPFTQH